MLSKKMGLESSIQNKGEQSEAYKSLSKVKQINDQRLAQNGDFTHQRSMREMTLVNALEMAARYAG